MPFRVIAIVAILVVVGGGLMIHFRQQNLVDKAVETKQRVDTSDIPEPAKGSQVPKAVPVDGTLYDFGTMAHGSKGEHVFKIRNEGQAPLKLVARKQDHSCQCTLGSLGAEGLQPGEETTVTLSWEIKNPSMHFQHWAKIRTNDPNKEGQEITFRVRGLVGKQLGLRPGNEISLGSVTTDQPVVRKVFLFSELVDEFQLKSVTTSNPAMTAVYRPATKEELVKLSELDPEAAIKEGRIGGADMHPAATGPTMKELIEKQGLSVDEAERRMQEMADTKNFESTRTVVKSAYEITITLPITMPVGHFRETVNLETDLVSQPIIVSLEGTRAGSLQLLGTPGFGWSPEQKVLVLGRFKASEGKKARLLAFVNQGDEELKITSSRLVPETIKVELVKDEKFKAAGREKYDLLIEIPPGALPFTSGAERSSSIVLQTNREDVGELKIELEFSSF